MPNLHTRRCKSGSHGVIPIDGRRYTVRFNFTNQMYAVRREGRESVIGWIGKDGRLWKIEGRRIPFASKADAATALVRGIS